MSSRVPWDPTAPTPFSENPWPSQLTARVVEPGADPRIHGYSVKGDLALNYRFSDVLFLSVTGELPNEEQSGTFERALILLSPISIAEAPSHAASLARVCDATTSAVIGTGAIALAEQARWMIDRHRPFLASLARGDAAPASELEHIFALLYACGIHREEQLEAVWVVARIAIVSAEGLATPAASFREYPLNVPEVRYEEP